MSGKRFYRKLWLRLSDTDRGRLRALLRKGHEPARVLKRAAILNLLDKGERVDMVSRLLDASPTTVRTIGWRYMEQGLGQAIYDRPRPGRRLPLDVQL